MIMLYTITDSQQQEVIHGQDGYISVRALRDNADPIVGLNNDGRLAVFIVNDNNAVYYKRQSAQVVIHGQAGHISVQQLNQVVRLQ